MARLEVITGPMFSGKSEEVIRRLNRATYAEKNILVVKPKIDTRNEKKIASRKKKDKKRNFEESDSFPAHEISSAEEFISLVSSHKPDVLAIDEAQLFTPSIPTLPSLVNELLEKNENQDFTIIISGLDLDALRKPFGIMPDFIAMADPSCITKLSAICFQCKKRPANLTYLKTESNGSKNQVMDSQILVGNFETYEARCWQCWPLA